MDKLIVHRDTMTAVCSFNMEREFQIRRADEKPLSYEVPAEIEVIGESCFEETQVDYVTFAAGSRLKRIEKNAFAGCMNLKSIEIPASVEVIGENCFGIPEDVDKECSGVWGYNAQHYKGALERITFASGSCLKRIEDRAFQCCSGMKGIVVPPGVELGKDCFPKSTVIRRK